MKFVCESCRARYRISPERIRQKIWKVTCRNCDARLLVSEALFENCGDQAIVAPLAVTTPMPKRRRSSSTDVLKSAQQHDRERLKLGRFKLKPLPAHARDDAPEWHVSTDGQQSGPFRLSELVERAKCGGLDGRRHHVWKEGFESWLPAFSVPKLRPYLRPAATPPPVPPSDGTGDFVEVSSDDTYDVSPADFLAERPTETADVSYRRKRPA